ncbi:MAG: hypothetical protein SCJ93_14165 [Bacillota bacterium]|nr:hypothetical protein [Bacillota bacterium]
MGRKAKIESSKLISLIDQFYAERCFDDNELLKIPEIGKYIRSKGYDVADYIIRRNLEAKRHIKELKEDTEEAHMYTVTVYRDIDMDSFLMKNNTKEKLKKAIIERENYYRKVTNSASYSFKENKQLKCQINELKNQISEIKKELKMIVNSESNLENDNKRYSDENQNLRDIINTYVYPEIANQLLKENGLVKNNSDIVDSEIIKKEIFNSESDVNKIKNKIIKGLFDSI